MNETELARMVVRLLGDSTSYVGMLRGAVSATTQATAIVERQAAQIEGYGRNLTGFAQQVKYSLLGAVGVLGVFGTAMNALQRSGEAEDIRTSFGVMLQDMRSGEILVRRIQQLAAETPLETRTLTAAAKTLLQFNAVAANEVVPTLRMIGDTVGGRAEELSRMAYAFGQVGATGRLMGQDLMQMINAGFNPLQEISRTTGKSLAQLKDDMEKGLITFDMVKNAFKTATSQGGRFFQGMEQGSKTLNGLFSTLKDDVGLTLQDVGDALVRGFDLKEVIKNLSQFAQEVRKWSNVAADGLIFLKDNVNGLLLNNRELVVTAAQVAGALAGLWAVVRAGGVAVGLALFVVRLLKIDLVVSAALWLGWSAALLVAKGVMLLLNAAVITFNVASAAATFLLSTHAIATAAVTAATWLWNAALVVLNSLLSITNLLGAAAAVGLIVFALAAAYGVAMALYRTGVGLFDLFAGSGGIARGPMAEFSRMLDRWSNVIGNITGALQVDFALGWKFAVAYGKLAQEQIKDLWPPLWAFLQEGFAAVWRFVSFTFKTEFMRAYASALAEVAKSAALTEGQRNKVQADIDRLNEHVRKGQAKAAEAATEILAAAAGKFKIVEGEGAKAAAKTVKELEDALLEAQLDKIWDDAVKGSEVIKSGQAMANGLAPVTHAAHQAHAAVQELKGALVGSNQGFQRLLEQRDFLENRNIGLSATGAQGRIAQTNINLRKTEQTLDAIKLNTAKAADAPPLIIGVAGI